MADYLIANELVPYITDTDLSKYAVLSTETDTVKLRYLDDWNLLVDDAEIYLDSLMHRRRLSEYTDMDDVRKPVRRLLGAYLSYKIAFDRIANNPQQNITELQYDLYKNKVEFLYDRWLKIESDLTNYDYTGIDSGEEASTSTVDLFRR